MSSPLWFYQVNGTPSNRGVPAMDLVARLRLGVIRWDTLVRSPDLSPAWQPLEEVWGAHLLHHEPDPATLHRVAHEENIPLASSPNPQTVVLTKSPLTTQIGPPPPPIPRPGILSLVFTTLAVFVIAVGLILATPGLVQKIQSRAALPADPVSDAIASLLHDSALPSWSQLERYGRLLQEHPNRRNDILPHATNFLVVAEFTLLPADPEFLSCTNVLELLLPITEEPASRLLARGYLAHHLPAAAQPHLAQLTRLLESRVASLGASLASSDLPQRLAEIDALVRDFSDLSLSVEARLCPLLQDLPTPNPGTAVVALAYEPLLRRLADQKCAIAAYLLAEGFRTENRTEDAQKYYELASNIGHPDSGFLLALLLTTGVPDAHRDWNRIVNGLESSASKGHLEAKVRLAEVLLSDKTLATPLANGRRDRAITLLREVGQTPNPAGLPEKQRSLVVRSMELFGASILYGRVPSPQLKPEAIERLRSAVNLGSDPARRTLGRYLSGMVAGYTQPSPTEKSEGIRLLEEGARNAASPLRASFLNDLALHFKNSDPTRAKQYADEAATLRSR